MINGDLIKGFTILLISCRYVNRKYNVFKPKISIFYTLSDIRYKDNSLLVCFVSPSAAISELFLELLLFFWAID